MQEVPKEREVEIAQQIESIRGRLREIKDDLDKRRTAGDIRARIYATPISTMPKEKPRSTPFLSTAVSSMPPRRHEK